MLHPSYTELMNAVNSDVAEGEKPIVNSRYSIVIATAKRARQLIANADSNVEDYRTKKPLSVAVEEILKGDVKVLSGGADIEDDEDKPIMTGDVYDIALEADDEEIFEDEIKEEAEDEEDEESEDQEDDEDSPVDSDEDMGSEEDDYE